MRREKLSPEQIITYIEWASTEEQTKTLTELAEQMNVTERSLVDLKHDLEGTDAFNEIAKFRKQVFKRAMDAKATAKHMELYARLNPELREFFIEKKELTHKFELSADDHLRIREESRKRVRELSESGGGADGDRGVFPEPNLLPQKVRDNPRQD